ncbi:hypothetical protein CASFOL_027194 [Castilleja foliolosa]|uniref:Late embryogenesis abundant protein LEA-2 subgroup domain-containing protein n=1 Tax=Castilleja foliolosa TaxID=1961234 RepID=A0ABD3CE44_9LAMI
MGMPPASSDKDHKQKITMGYPSMGRYNQAQYTFHAQPTPPPPPYPVPCGPQGYSSNYHPHPYAPTSSYPFPHGYQDPSPYLSSVPSQKPYPQQQYNNDYYYHQHQQQQQMPYKPLVIEPNNSSSFGRVMLVLMVVLVASMCMMTLVMWFLFGTYIPEFEVKSLKVTNFTVTDTALTGLWDVDISVSNTNKDLTIGFDRVMSSIFYKESLLGVETVKPFNIPQMQQTDINFTMPAEQLPSNQKLQSWVLPTLANEHDNGGVVIFSLRLAMKANFTAPNMVYRQENVRVLCENMQIMFSSPGEGTLSPGLGNTCLIRINDGLKDY